MNRKKYEIYTMIIENTVVKVERYNFSSAFYIEIIEVDSKDYAIWTHKGANQFRIDFTKIGRFECEFLDHTFSYRGENEITVLATPKSENWIISSSIPTNCCHDCAIVIELDKLREEDLNLFEKLGINFSCLIEILGIEQKWCKLSNSNKFIDIFNNIYIANEDKNSEMIFLKALEALVLLSKTQNLNQLYPLKSDFLSAKHVRIVKKIHAYVLRKYDITIYFEQLALEHRIGYSQFNNIFKTIYGETPYQYLKKIRINISAQKLKETNLSIMDIALSVGYSNASKFSNAFKSIMGELPHTFRNL